jgi:hypothetical protein
MLEPCSDAVVKSGETRAAELAVESAASESQPAIPVYSNDGHLASWVTETQASAILKAKQGYLIRDKYGIMRRICLRDQPATHGPGAERQPMGSINSEASRTIRRESVGDIYKCYGHIVQDLGMKRRITIEELVADGILPMKGQD